MSNKMQLPGMNKIFDRMFRRADDLVVWDLMTGKLGVRTDDGIATLDGSGEDSQVNVNLLDDFSMPLPAFAQSTPKNGVMEGDIIIRGKGSIAWVVEKKEVEKDGVTTYKFKLMKPNGETTSWNPPKISLMGFESGVMVVRSLISMLPGGQGDLSNMQGMLMPMMMLMGDDEDSGDMLEKMMPMILMQMMSGQGNNANGMGGMMQMMMMAKLLGKGGGGSPFDMFGKKSSGNSGSSGPFDRR